MMERYIINIFYGIAPEPVEKVGLHVIWAKSPEWASYIAHATITVPGYSFTIEKAKQ